jgi:ABC-type nitrate/sulfonate/bicarbonate transport system substrate-binding protein
MAPPVSASPTTGVSSSSHRHASRSECEPGIRAWRSSRRWRHRGTLVAAALLSVVACGCGSSSGGSTSASPVSPSQPAALATVSIALDYSANVDYLGIYVAISRGYFRAAGVQARIIPYAGTPAEPLIRSGTADLGISYPPDVIINRAQGLHYKAVAALVAHNTTALAVLASSSYTRPGMLSGALYGGFGIESDPPIIATIMHNDGVTHPVFRQVVLNTDVITALAHHRIGYTAVFGGIDDVTAELQGVHLRTFPYRQWLGAAGDYPNAVFVAADNTITHRADTLRRTLAALAQGYAFAATHPREAEQILIADNRTALGSATRIVTATGDAIAPTFLAADGRWGAMSPTDFAGLSQILVSGGVVHNPVPIASLYTNALLPSR